MNNPKNLEGEQTMHQENTPKKRPPIEKPIAKNGCRVEDPHGKRFPATPNQHKTCRSTKAPDLK
jgi:hypothetical protein